MKHLQKIIEYGLYLLVFLLPVQTRWIIGAGVNEYGTYSLYGTGILLILLIIIFIVFKITNPKLQITNKIQNPKSKIQNPWFFIAIIEFGAFVSIFFAPDKFLAVYGYAKLLLGIGLFWLVTSANYDKLKLIYSFLAGVALQAGLGIWQFLTQSSFASKWLGMAAHNAADLGTSVVETLSGERWLRAYGGLDHPNILGGVMAVSILILVFNRIYGGQFSIFNFQFSNNFLIFKFSNIFTFYFLLFTFTTSLFFTFSRGAWAGALVGLLVMLVMTAWQVKFNPPTPLSKGGFWGLAPSLQVGLKRLLAIIFAGAILVAILFSQYGDLFLTRLSRDTRLEVKSNAERAESYREGWRVIKNNWLTGVGIGNYTLVLRNYELGIMNYDGHPSWYYQPPHNVFLLIWSEAGILGLLGLVGLLGYLGFLSMVNGQWSMVGRLSVLVALTAMMTVDHWFWSLHFGILFFWFILGIITSVTNQQPTTDD